MRKPPNFCIFAPRVCARTALLCVRARCVCSPHNTTFLFARTAAAPVWLRLVGKLRSGFTPPNFSHFVQGIKFCLLLNECAPSKGKQQYIIWLENMSPGFIWDVRGACKFRKCQCEPRTNFWEFHTEWDSISGRHFLERAAFNNPTLTDIQIWKVGNFSSRHNFITKRKSKNVFCQE